MQKCTRKKTTLQARDKHFIFILLGFFSRVFKNIFMREYKKIESYYTFDLTSCFFH